MTLLDELAERHIQQALECGEFDDLPGRGQPLRLDDDSLVPPELRAAYRLLKNSGHLPPELELSREIRSVEDLLRVSTCAEERSRARRRLLLLRTRLAHARGGQALLEAGYYTGRVLERLDRGS